MSLWRSLQQTQQRTCLLLAQCLRLAVHVHVRVEAAIDGMKEGYKRGCLLVPWLAVQRVELSC